MNGFTDAQRQRGSGSTLAKAISNPVEIISTRNIIP